MRIRVLGCSGGETATSKTTCLLIDDRVAIDAGALASVTTLEEQYRVDSVVLTHGHADHIQGLPFFVENVLSRVDPPVDVYGSAATLRGLRQHIFNNQTWPDFSRLPNSERPILRFKEFDEAPFRLHGVRFTPIPVSHTTTTHGFIIEDDDAAIVWSSDTGPTDQLWRAANAVANLKLVCVEVSFPNPLQAIADASGHLTPKTLQKELRKLSRNIPVLVHHIKPPHIEAIRREVSLLQNTAISFLREGETYDF